MDNQLLSRPEKSPVDWNNIKLVVFDCDGVLTDGKMIYQDTHWMTKAFSAHDGMGFTLLHRAGLISAVITGRKSRALRFRCADLNISHLCEGIENKLACLGDLLQKLDLNWDRVAYIGDDWNDVPCMRKVAISACPADVMPELKLVADIITQRNSDQGSAREFIDFILKQKGIYDQVVISYLEEISRA